jgi:tetratricopeptide (TPR) repeat protein/tRNA A-37 threonylcarbamoyl transferase component Bud32
MTHDVDLESAASGEQPGAQIGRYKLLEQIGEGGMGTIWMAEQREPVKRRVALKIIKLGMDTKQVIARFEAERQALAMMDHPHIAKVLDAGATETGRPYFVMEYIKGIPILAYCDQERVDTSGRLELFASVCHAIQHAHQKGIIHRDIKPSNVLVTLHDGVPVPKVIDFGIAKATNSELTSKTLFTEHRQMIGTPAYMSPEQAEMSGLDIDTRSDIYSLGVLLYELLTGTTPFDMQALLEGSFAEMMRTIREVEPHKPSTRISALGETAARTAQQRHVDVKKLGAALRGDLDWIVMKCLEKDRTRRYETANGLAADIRRHLNDEPVTAGPPSAAYRMRKFVRRNRGQVVAGGIVAAALVLGVIGTTTGMMRAVEERERAENAAAQEKKARTRAETISEFVTTALKASDATNADGRQDMTILAAMDAAIADLESGRFRDDPETEAGLQDTIALILMNNGQVARAEPLAAHAFATRKRLYDGDHVEVAASLNTLGDALYAIGRFADAEALYAQRLEMERRLRGGDHQEVAASLDNLAQARVALGRLAESEPLFVEALEMRRRLVTGDHQDVAESLNNLAGMYANAGRPADAEPLFVEALGMYRRLHPGDYPYVAVALGNVATIRCTLGRYAEAEPLAVQTLEMYRRLFAADHQGTAFALMYVAQARRGLGRPADALPLAVEALEMRRRLYGGGHPILGESLVIVAELLIQLGRDAEAEPLLVEAVESLARFFPRGHFDTTRALSALASVRIRLGRTEEAEAAFAKLTEILERLEPGNFRAAVESALLLANTLVDSGQPDAAQPHFERALAISRRIAPRDDMLVADTLNEVGVFFWSRGRLDRSIPLFEEGLALRDAAGGRQDPSTILAVGNLGINYLTAGRLDEALPLLEDAFERSRQSSDRGPCAQYLLKAYAMSVEASRPVDSAKVAALIELVVAELRETLPQDGPDFAAGLAGYALTLLRLQAWTSAEPLLRECLAIRDAKAPEDWTTFNTKSLLGAALLGQQRFDEAKPLLLDGYRGMKEREATIPAEAAVRIPEALERLVRFYEATGEPTEAAAWRAELDEARVK